MCASARLRTCAFARTAPKSAMFSASVQFFVKMTRSASAHPKKRASSVRARSTFSACASAAACPLRPGFAQMPSTQARTGALYAVRFDAARRGVVKVKQEIAPFEEGTAPPAFSYTGIRYYYMPRLPKG